MTESVLVNNDNELTITFTKAELVAISAGLIMGGAVIAQMEDTFMLGVSVFGRAALLLGPDGLEALADKFNIIAEVTKEDSSRVRN